MNCVILTKTYTEPPFCEREILRYAGCKEATCEMVDIIRSCIDEIRANLSYKVCYSQFPLKTNDFVCDFNALTFHSKNLAQNLNGCNSAVLFAATIGVEIDRLIAKYGRISPSRALVLQAIGAERIEALCNTFCADIAKEYNLNTKPRFSPGYGDLPISCQKDIFSILSPQKHIGLFLTESLLMSPSKSVTAIVGLTENRETATQSKCTQCNQKDCIFRGAL